ncbi:MAG: succinate dehydrogenase assembly factor 2 [Gammaproteobacteria bacterium]|nr:succinate dehydrogenase assembly factor 2 [Gammaproteobacteria bacterium]
MDVSRLKWQCRRGMLELDLMLEAFVERVWPTLNESERRSFEALLEYPDQMLFDYLLGDIKPTDGEMMRVIERIRQSAAD